MVLVDTSVWIDFFSSRPKPHSRRLSELIEAGQVVTCRQVIAEILSGQMSRGTRTTIADALTSLKLADPDWNSPSTWENVVELAVEGRAAGRKVPGLVDRMILLTAVKWSALVWTYDQKLEELAEHYRCLYRAGKEGGTF